MQAMDVKQPSYTLLKEKKNVDNRKKKKKKT